MVLPPKPIRSGYLDTTVLVPCPNGKPHEHNLVLEGAVTFTGGDT